MMALILIGIPIAVAVLLFGILTLPDEEEKKVESSPSTRVTSKASKKKK